MRNILLLIKNNLKVTFRKKGNYIIYLLLPLVGIFFSLAIYGGAGTTPMNIGLIDHDQSTLSIHLAKEIEASGSYKVFQLNETEINSKLLDQSLEAVVIIPAGYEESIHKNSPDKIKMLSLKGKNTTIWLEQFFNLQTRNLADLSVAAEGDRNAFNKMYDGYINNVLKVSPVTLEDQSTSKGITVQSLGFLLMFVMLGAGLTSNFILDEKKSRTYYRICSSPVTSREYLAANALTSLVIVAAQILLILLVLKYLFRIETFVPGFVLFLVLLLFGLTAIGIGLVITAFSSSSYMATTFSTLIFTPTCMLGGCFWPVTFMSDTMQKIAHFMPQWWVLDAIQKMQSGSTFTDILMNIAILLAFTAALFLIAAYRFSREGNVRKFV